jgi:hypothetical protein
MADGNGPIMADSTDDDVRARTLRLGYRFGGSLDFIAYVLQLERRICKLEQANAPAHLHDLEKR